MTLMDVLVEHQVGHQTLAALALIAQLAQRRRFGQAELSVLLRPDIEACLANAHLPTDVCDRRAAFCLARRLGDLLVRESFALHGPRSPSQRTPEVSSVHF